MSSQPGAAWRHIAYSRWQCLTCEAWHRGGSRSEHLAPVDGSAVHGYVTPRTGTLCPGAVCLKVTAARFTSNPTTLRSVAA